MDTWARALRADSLDWLLEPSTPAVRHLALRQLLDRPPDDPDVVASGASAMAAEPIASILAAQQPDGHWEKPGPGLRDQVPGHGLAAACSWTSSAPTRPTSACSAPASTCWPTARRQRRLRRVGRNSPRPAAPVGRDPLPQRQPAAGADRLRLARRPARAAGRSSGRPGRSPARAWSAGTPPRHCGPGFACAANERLPCAWGAVKAIGALARIPADRRAPLVRSAIDQGVDFLLSRDPADADYPAGWGNTPPQRLVVQARASRRATSADVLQNLEVAGRARARPRTLAWSARLDWLLAKQDARRALAQRVRLQRQDLGRLRAPGPAQQVGHPAGLPLPASRARLSPGSARPRGRVA